ncbi:MAG: hypothetical protein EOM37_05410 [Proteobacteria bacterium]|nr:hypothetical protein [Pseudomonadota bacterium]
MSDVQYSYRIVDQITTAKDKRFELVAHMADAIIAMTLEGGGCLPGDLHVKGFMHQDIATHWHFANALASVELNCRLNSIGSCYVKEVRYA